MHSYVISAVLCVTLDGQIVVMGVLFEVTVLYQYFYSGSILAGVVSVTKSTALPT